MILGYLPDSKCLNLMSHAACIFDLENMVDNAGIGKEVILLKQPALFVMLDYFQLSSYQLQACALLTGSSRLGLTAWSAAPSSTLKPGALKADSRKPSKSAGSRAALHYQHKVSETLKVSAA